MNTADKIRNFDPNAIGDANNNIYGLPFDVADASIVIIPVPWEVTVSYNAGTAEGPEAIFEASYQVDLYDPLVKDAWKMGLAMDEVNEALKRKGQALREKAEKYIDLYSQGKLPERHADMLQILEEINAACADMNAWVKSEALRYLDQGKFVALLGGDHSTPLGLMQALAEKHKAFGILHIDAHADLRDAYEGFEFSHASIMFNAIKMKQISKLVQVGIRDYCEAEVNVIQSDPRIITYFDRDLKHREYAGENWAGICHEIIGKLPEKVYISLDIDGLDPKLCPNTGTPVPGGLEFEQVLFLVEKLTASGRKVIGFDLNEVSPGEGEWDANVAARLLYRMVNLCAPAKIAFAH
jgi:agmatinase